MKTPNTFLVICMVYFLNSFLSYPLLSQHCNNDVSAPFGFVLPHLIIDLEDQILPFNLDAKSFNLNSWDDCTKEEDLRFSFSEDVSDSTMQVDDTYPGESQIKIFVFDQSGNFDQEESILHVTKCSQDDNPPVAVLKDYILLYSGWVDDLTIHASVFDNGSYQYCKRAFDISFSENPNDTIRIFDQEDLFVYGHIAEQMEIFLTDSEGRQSSKFQNIFIYDCSGCFPVYPVDGVWYFQQRPESGIKDSILVDRLGVVAPDVCHPNTFGHFSLEKKEGIVGNPKEYIWIDHITAPFENLEIHAYQYGDYTYSCYSDIRIQDKEPVKIQYEEIELVEGNTYMMSLYLDNPVDLAYLRSYITFYNGVNIREVRVPDKYSNYFNITKAGFYIDFEFQNEVEQDLILEGVFLQILFDSRWDGKLTDRFKFPDHSFRPKRWESKKRVNYAKDHHNDYLTVEYKTSFFPQSYQANVFIDCFDFAGEHFNFPFESDQDISDIQFRFTDADGLEIEKLEPCFSEDTGAWYSFIFCLDTTGHQFPYTLNVLIDSSSYKAQITTLSLVLLQKHIYQVIPTNVQDSLAMDYNCDGVFSITDFFAARESILAPEEIRNCYDWYIAKYDMDSEESFTPSSFSDLPYKDSLRVIDSDHLFKSDSVLINIENKEIIKDSVYQIKLTAGESFESRGFQFGFEFDTTAFSLLTVYKGEDLSHDLHTWKSQGNTILTSMGKNEFEVGDEICKLLLFALENGTIDKFIYPGNSRVYNEFTNADIRGIPIKLGFDDTVGWKYSFEDQKGPLVYPVPICRGKSLTVKNVTGHFTIKLFDITRREIYNNYFDLNVENTSVLLPGKLLNEPGIYIIHIQQKGKLEVQKIIVQ